MKAQLELSGAEFHITATKDEEVSISIEGAEPVYLSYLETLLLARTLTTAAAELKDQLRASLGEKL